MWRTWGRAVLPLRVVLCVGAWFAGGVSAGELEPAARAQFRGDILAADDLSGVAVHSGFLALCADETVDATVIQLLRRDDDEALSYSLHATIPLRDDDEEVDLEGVASDGRFVYAIGSHSRVRKAAKSEKSRANNLERLLDIDAPESRDVLYRVRMNDEGLAASESESVSLRDVIDGDPYLNRFTKIPSKENGVDIEGIATDGDLLYVGFRGPVLRGNYVPVLLLEFDDPDEAELRFVDLDGLGIRDLCAVEDGFLILAGPVGDATEGYDVYFWDGEDRIPDRGRAVGEVTRLTRLKGLDGGKPEGLAVLEEAEGAFDVLIVHDGPNGGAPAVYHLTQ